MLSAEKRLFSETPVMRAIFELAFPAVLSQLITVIYNMADTFFIGQMGDPAQVAAATIALPLFTFLTGVANLFGIGGSSLISRALGAGDRQRAAAGASFCIYGAAIVALVYGFSIVTFRTILLPLIGVTSMTYEYCASYVFWTMGLGSAPTVLNTMFSHLVRAEGYSREASFGVAFGGVLNIALDPIFIFTLGLQIRGAAIATMLSNVAATAYFVIFIHKIRLESTIRFSPRWLSLGRKVAFEVLSIGVPSFVACFLSSFANGTLNKIVSAYSSEAIAGMGIAKKIHLAAFCVAHGMTQGPLPLIGYNYSSGNKSRMMEAIKKLFLCCITIGVSETVIFYVAAGPIAHVFIDNAATVNYATSFLKIICLDGPTTILCFLIITLFQATGQKLQPLFLSFLRKGTIDVPFMFLFDSLFGLAGVAWATPCSDFIAFAISLATFLPHVRKLK